MSAFEKKIEEQESIIRFLKSRYERDTGRKLVLPSSLGHLLGDPSLIGQAKEIEDEEETKHADAGDAEPSKPRTKKPRRPDLTMMEAVEELKLPKPLPKDKKQDKRKLINLAPELTIMKIDISGFRDRGVSRSALKELVDGIDGLPCLRSVCLRNNGITDDCEREILALFDQQKVRSIDLSQNCLRKTAAAIGKKLKDEITHIFWLDLTQNEFDNDFNTHVNIINGLKKQKELIHIGLSCGIEPPKAITSTAKEGTRSSTAERNTKKRDDKKKEGNCATD
jgi:hypothetical protein